MKALRCIRFENRFLIQYLSLCIQRESNEGRFIHSIIDHSSHKLMLTSCKTNTYYNVQLNYVVQSGFPIHSTASCCVPEFTSSWILCISTTASRLPAPIRRSSYYSRLPPNKTVRSFEMEGILSTICGNGTTNKWTISQEPR